MGSFLSLDNNNNPPNKNEDWTLTPETTLTGDSLNLPKNIISNVDDNLNSISKDINIGLTKGYNTITTTTEDIFQSINNGLKSILDLTVDGIDNVANRLGIYSNSDISATSPFDENISDTTKEQLIKENTSDNIDISTFETPISQSQINQYINSPTSPIQSNTEQHKEQVINQPKDLTIETNTSEIDKNIQKIIDKNIITQPSQSSQPTTQSSQPTTQSSQPTTQSSQPITQSSQSSQPSQQPKQQINQASTTSSINTTQLSTLNLNDNNILTMNLSRF